MSSDLIQAAGSLDALAHMEATEITEICKGIGMAKASTLCAAFELGARALRETLARRPLNTPEDIYDYLTTAMRWKDKETVLVLLLDAQCRLIKPVEISTGTLNESIAHPRDILRPAIIHNAYGFILAHNHPSGNPAPQPSGRYPDRTHPGIRQTAGGPFSGPYHHRKADGNGTEKLLQLQQLRYEKTGLSEYALFPPDFST